jgi:hypothetical protein
MLTNLAYMYTRMTVPQSQALYSTLTHIRWLSPLDLYSPTSARLLYSAYFAAWAAVALWAAFAWWKRAPYERLHAPFYFPRLWNLWYGLLALATGFVLSALIRPFGASPPSTVWVVPLLAIPAWFLWRAIFVRMGRSGLGFGPTADW